MQSMKNDVKAITRGLKTLTKKTEQITKKVEKLEKAKPVQKRTTKAKTTKKVSLKKKATKRTPAKRKTVVIKAKATVRKAKAATVTATARVLGIVNRFKKGVSIPVLMKKTRFDAKKVQNILSKAFAQGRVRRVHAGVYAAA